MTSDKTFKILYFASASSLTGRDSELLSAPLELGSLFGKLEQLYPGIKADILGSCAVTLNLSYVDLDTTNEKNEPIVIQAGDEIGIIPPVSSG
jgi:molybdopterin converting factor small subunit